MSATFTDHPGGDIFESGADVLVCPVNCVPGVMGAGLALEFAKRWPGLKAVHRLVARRGDIAPGRVYMCGFTALFPTKRDWHDRSLLGDIKAGLASLAAALPEEHWGAKSIAIPALGCGLGGLDWADVRPLIVDALADLPLRVMLYPPHEVAP